MHHLPPAVRMRAGRRCDGSSGVRPDAQRLYDVATYLDGIKGHYPPSDTGTSGLAVMKAACALGYATSYSHAFGLAHALQALVLTPVITGVNWYDSFDKPDHNGTVTIGGHVRGGHEFEVVGLDVERQMVRACNSWGSSWGDRGYFQFSFDTWDRLLDQRGDVITTTRSSRRPSNTKTARR
jgi:hypothetical protein